MNTLNLIRTVLVLCAATSLGLAHAQWSWKDKDGRRIFSDQPPPSSVPEADILKRPGGLKAPVVSAAAQRTADGSLPTGMPESTATVAAPARSASAASGAKPPSGKDAELEKRKKEAEAKDAAKKKEDDQKNAAARQDNCERATTAKAGLDAGERMSTRNKNGEREVMNEEARAAESKRLAGIMASDCKK